MTEAVILAAARTPIGRANKGSLVDVDAFELARVAVSEAIARSGVPAADIDDIVLAESLQGGGVIARYVAVELGLDHVPGLADNRHCAAGLSAAQIAAGSIRAGMDQLIVAGGTESLSSMPQSLKSVPASARDYKPWMSPSHRATPEAPAFDMSITVGENTAREAGLTRQDVDEWAMRSNLNAAASIAAGDFKEEIVAVEVPDGNGGTRTFDTDEHPRADTTMERLSSLKPLHPELDAPTVTAGNAAGLNDAAAALVIASDGYASANGFQPLARIRSWASVGVAPARTGLAPIDADPQGARPRRPRPRRHRPVRDQRGVLLGSRRRVPRPRHRPRDPQRERQRVRPGPPHRGHRRAHGGHHAPRAAPSRRAPRARVDVRGRRDGLRAGARAALSEVGGGAGRTLSPRSAAACPASRPAPVAAPAPAHR